MKKDCTKIGKIAKDLMHGLSKERKTREEDTTKAWYSAADKRFHKHTQPASFRRGRLVITVDSSGVLYELTMKRQQISLKLKKELKNEFKELHFRIGKIGD